MRIELKIGIGLFVFFIWFSSAIDRKREQIHKHEIALAKIKCEVRK